MASLCLNYLFKQNIYQLGEANTPVGGGVWIVVCEEDLEVVDVVCCAAVIAVYILGLAKVVQSRHLFSVN